MAAISATATTSVITTTSIPLWIPEDDLLLKNAIEAGASLEALAKGAVKFSRKFSVRELSDRWHSLLYDNDVSAEASSRMVELHLSNFSLPKLNTNTSSSSSKFGVAVKESDSVKRKFECVRQLYYEMRKKMRKRGGEGCGDFFFLDSLDGGSFEGGVGFGGSGGFGEDDRVRFGFVGGNEGGEGDVCIERENVRKDVQDIEDGLVECQDSERSEAPGSCDVPESDALIHAGRIESLAPRVPLGKGMEDVSAPKMPSSVNVEGKGHSEGELMVNHGDVHGNKMNLVGVEADHSRLELRDETVFDVLDRSTAISESDFPDISDSLMNFPNDDDPLFIDVNGKDAMVKACYDSITTSLLVSSPNDVQGDVPDVKDPVISASDTSLGIPDGACPAELEVIAEESHSVGGNKDIHSVSEMDTPPSSSASAPKNLSSDENDVEMECTLNMEDFEIPCNDDVFIGKTIASPIKEQTSYMTHNLPSSRINKKDCKQEVILLKKEEIPAQCRTSPQIVGWNMLPVTNPRCQPVCSDAKCDSRALISRSVITTHVEPSEGGAALGSPTSSTIGLPKSGSLHEKLSLPIKFISVPSTSNQEESGSDDDVPSFSDIEAMILEMDLCPDDSDSFINHEVSRYQNEDAMRAIIRLEQCAQSSMQRAIASRGALAVLYGRHLKHYIKDTEVMLGRATEDMDVDIDLGREGPANKISRRQALIKMEGDGSFFLKNLGKSPMFLNGKELTSGQSMGLRSSSLIEIREMAFVFEVNRKSVTRHLVSVIKNHKENNFKSKWSDKGVNHREADFKFEWSEGIP
ncbi:FHA DOMAIN PROTEIN [Salix purpurea]|uniref:FHA DOMAIN PROTEIN n=2 Tax=Salix purpurea TaxID=77065 RepID=A0A9Q0WXE0_SALPP|nr:FHA DOMAIN PROTEIN [Salix purpurea]